MKHSRIASVVALLVLFGAGCGSSTPVVQTPVPAPNPDTNPFATFTRKAGEPLYALCQDVASGKSIYLWYTMGVDAGSYGYYDSSGQSIGSYNYVIPRGGHGTEIRVTQCAQLSRTDFSSHIKDQSSLPNDPLATPPVTEDVTKTILVSKEDTTKYCNGADMDSAGYRKSITVEKPIDVPPGTQLATHVKMVAVAATTGMCQTALNGSDFSVKDGVVTIPPIEGWAGISIAMCSCQPQVEVNLLRLPGITKVVWGTM